MADLASAVIHVGDAAEVLRSLPEGSVNTCITSPPYWGLRNYDADGQIGLESTPEEYVARLVEVFREVRRVLRDDGTVWLVIGDSYATGAGKVGDCPGGGEQGARWAGRGVHTAENSGKAAARVAATGPMTQPNRMPIPGLKPKDLVGIPWRVAFALQADGWFLRSDIIWHKPNPMPESVTDRCTKAHEYVFLLSKADRYFYDAAAIAEQAAKKPNAGERTFGPKGQLAGMRRDIGNGFVDNGTRNRRSVWTVPTTTFPGSHFAVFPEALIQPCVLAGCPEGGTVLDPFAGAGTTGIVAVGKGRNFVGVELNPEYADMARNRIAEEVGILLDGGVVT